MPMTSKEMIKHLEKSGFVIDRQRGSHIILKNDETGKTATVPYHNKDLKKGTEQKILKDAGLR